MYYKLYVEGEFENIRGVCVDQTVQIAVKCDGCGYVPDHPYVLSSESTNTTDEKEKGNLVIKCKGCAQPFCFKIMAPEDVYSYTLSDEIEANVELKLTKMINNRFHVSTIHSNAADILDVKPSNLTIVSSFDEVFDDVSVEKRCVSLMNKSGKVCSITNFSLKVEQVKKHQ